MGALLVPRQSRGRGVRSENVAPKREEIKEVEKKEEERGGGVVNREKLQELRSSKVVFCSHGPAGRTVPNHVEGGSRNASWW